MRKLFLHIGIPKTGSSSIQQYLSDHRDHLAKSGVLFPRSACLQEKDTAHNALAYPLMRDYPRLVDRQLRRPIDQVAASLDEEIQSSKANRIIISSEALSHCGKHSARPIRWLKDNFRAYEVRVIAYVRRPDAWLASAYAQAVKSNVFTTQTISEYLASRQVTYFRPLHEFANVFGDDNMTVRIFSREHLHRGNVLADFLNLVGLVFNSNDSLGQAKENVSPGPKTIELFRLLNEKLVMDDNTRSGLYRHLMDHFATHFPDPKTDLLTSRQRLEINKKYGREYRKLLDRFGLEDHSFQS